MTSFGDYVTAMHAAGRLVLQPRMGFGEPERMRAGLTATSRARACTVGTITVDSYTRLARYEEARAAVLEGVSLNGYPIVAHTPETNRRMLDGVYSHAFPVQVRHGSANPREIFIALMRSGLHATEGGPVSYCLPYGRVPLRDSIDNWTECCQLFAGGDLRLGAAHLETFGGCMLGQLCPPSLLIALSVLEAMFFRSHGVHSVSLSYAQQTNRFQDEQAVHALRDLAGEFLPGGGWHLVLYTYMGLYPRTRSGAYDLLVDSAILAVRTGVARLIVKTVAEAHRVPTIAENVEALEAAAATADRSIRSGLAFDGYRQIYGDARRLIEATLDLAPDIGTALLSAFRRGYLDVPYCLHPDNAGRSRSAIDASGWLHWADVGSMPIARGRASTARPITSATLLDDLSFMRRRYDGAARTPADPAAPAVGSIAS
jgi:methylaspartate mutase epsilon subunit